MVSCKEIMSTKNKAYNPVCIFAYKRPDALYNSLQALEKCKDASKTDLAIYIDGPKNDSEKDTVKKVLIVAEKFKNANFNSIKISTSPANKGLAKSVIAGVTEVLTTYNSVIVLEDDLIPTTDFLEYMNLSLDRYEGNKQVGSISGFGFRVSSNRCYSNYFHKRPTTWGWATWKDRWEMAVWDLSEENEILQPTFKSKFNKGGQDLHRMLINYLQGNIDSWGIRWAYSHYKNKWLASSPVYSKIINNGYGDDGTNCNGAIPPPINDGHNQHQSICFVKDIVESKELSKQVNWYNSNLYKLIYKIKQWLAV